jgi:hypothetical protein
MESVAIDTCFRVTCYVLRVAVKVLAYLPLKSVESVHLLSLGH